MAAALVVGACRGAPNDLETDRMVVGTIVAADLDLDRALKHADDLAREGKESDAADALRAAAPLAEEEVRLTETARVTTPWGYAQRDDWRVIARERRDELLRYEMALRGTDLATKLAAVEAQLALQRRALEAAKAARAALR